MSPSIPKKTWTMLKHSTKCNIYNVRVIPRPLTKGGISTFYACSVSCDWESCVFVVPEGMCVFIVAQLCYRHIWIWLILPTHVVIAAPGSMLHIELAELVSSNLRLSLTISLNVRTFKSKRITLFQLLSKMDLNVISRRFPDQADYPRFPCLFTPFVD